MNREILIHEADGLREIALTENGLLCEYLPDIPDSRTDGAVFLGRVERIVPGMSAAFVDIGQARNGFLPLQEKSETFQDTRLHTGDRVLVQIVREAHGEKGAFLTRDITVCGQLLILMPMNRYIGVSARIENRQHACRLRFAGAAMTGGEAGLVFRTAAENARSRALQLEYEALTERWREIRQKSATEKAPALIRSSEDALQVLIRDYSARGIDRIVTDGSLQDLPGGAVSTDRDPIAAAGCRPAIAQALSRRVTLPGGGNLIIDECEALTVIDVNSAAYTGEKRLERTLRSVNLEACAEVVRQIRLRNLSGIILVDMIDMAAEEDRAAVLAAMQEALEQDRKKTVVHGFTSLGLLEITRKRSDLTLRESMQTRKERNHDLTS